MLVARTSFSNILLPSLKYAKWHRGLKHCSIIKEDLRIVLHILSARLLTFPNLLCSSCSGNLLVSKYMTLYSLLPDGRPSPLLAENI